MSETLDEGIDVLDVLVFTAERWVILIVLPLFLAGAAFIVAENRAPVFVASTTLDYSSLPGGYREIASARRAYATEGVTSSLRQNSLRISARGATSAAAEGLVARVYRSAIAPAKQFARDELDRIAKVKSVIRTHTDKLTKLDTVSAAVGIATLESTLSDLREKEAKALAMLEATDEPPVVLTERQSPSSLLIAVASFFLSAIAVFLTCLVLHAYRRARQNEPTRNKLDRIERPIRT